jgi:hypothetical protein
MEFEPSRPDVVRAVNQRWLLKIWSRHLEGHRVPRWQAIEAERLLLPFGRDGQTVDRVLAAFEFFCADGAFDGHALTQRTDGPALRLSAQIEARA